MMLTKTRHAASPLRRAGLAGAALLALAAPALLQDARAGGTTGSTPMQTTAPDTPRAGLLTEGAGAVIAPGAPARLVLPRDRARAAESPLSLSLTPTRLAEDEAFLVSLVALLPDGGETAIGTYAFFPPPREGTPRRFPLDLTALPEGEGPVTLEVRLVPVEGGLEATRLRVEGVTAGE